MVDLDQDKIVLRKIPRQLIFDAALGLIASTLCFLVEINPRLPVPEVQLQTRADAPGQLANLFQTGFLRPINVADAVVADTAPILRWMIRNGVGSGKGVRVKRERCGSRRNCQSDRGNLHYGAFDSQRTDLMAEKSVWWS
jgi:hypothetical protein